MAREEPQMIDGKSRSSEPHKPSSAEPWLRATLTDVPAIPRAVLHALELAHEDLQKWCSELTSQELDARVANLPPVAFHLHHISRSLDRLLTYAEARRLTEVQLAQLKTEMEPGAPRDAVFAELAAALETSMERVRVLAEADLDQPRTVGAKSLPTTLGGLLVHVADHTQRHVGQAITTAKLIVAQRR
jgi:uncharacterized damage-inducible protein DinB